MSLREGNPSVRLSALVLDPLIQRQEGKVRVDGYVVKRPEQRESPGPTLKSRPTLDGSNDRERRREKKDHVHYYY